VKVAGVDYVTKIALNNLEPGKALKLPYDGLPASGRHTLPTVTFESRGQTTESNQQGNSCA
jgi:hypothetical protein